MRGNTHDRKSPESHLQMFRMSGYPRASLCYLRIPKPNLLAKSHRPNVWTAKIFLDKDSGRYCLIHSKGYKAADKALRSTEIKSRDVSGVVHVDGKLTVLGQEYKFKYLVDSEHAYIITSEDPRAED